MSYIYCIKDKSTDKVLYVGQSKNADRRKQEHFRDIKNKKHKIKQLNKYSVEELDFKVLLELKTDNSLVKAIAELMCIDLLHPLNKCLIQGFRAGTVTFARTGNKEFCTDVINLIKKYFT